VGERDAARRLRPLLARARDRARPVGEHDPLTSDRDVLARRWLLIDADPRRPAGISASDTEHEAALARAALAELPGFGPGLEDGDAGEGAEDDDSMSLREAVCPEAPTLL
jgi:hypothetical protein